tara:strand:+ start:15161 stop:16141 length:981 start_codon:yes stop_codon:yes gene_type:complete
MKINNLIYSIKKLYNIIDIDQINYELINYKSKLLENFIDITKTTKFANIPDVINYLEKSNYIYHIYLNNSNINLYVYSTKKLETFNYIKLLKLYKRISIIYKYYNLNKTINIHLTFWTKPRTLPKNDIFRPVHINGGFTSLNGNDIYIYRKDEYSKVILHEFIHHIHELNSSIMNISLFNIKKLKNFFNIHNNCHLEPLEAIIEFWSFIYNTIFISIEYSIPFKLLFKKELSFTLFQYNKLINNYKFINQWNEDTNIFSYIIIKLILLVNYKIFLKHNIPYNENIFVDFILNNFNHHNYLKLFKKNNNYFPYLSKNSMKFMLFSNF